MYPLERMTLLIFRPQVAVALLSRGSGAVDLQISLAGAKPLNLEP